MRRIRPEEVDRARMDPRLLDASEYRNEIQGNYRMSADDWLREGNCADAEPDLMYPEPREPVDEALALCASCPVRTPCLVRALEARDRHGVWGATAPRERRAMMEVWKDMAPIDPLAVSA
ncbi:WhiB family transcriptional regulator [Glycomyces buryatensis]|uniref:Transcriptional regulator WhiB n=1 Tax=Glycomyces buryatensis TaxID=2570927 RepID=A0A4S8QFX0_9ACTN|nr:WhiB family transcriptional regulator [Glycomyces buryatensis]THV43270.1 WhiB family transcriptional regulator [Glycomyces buryatensis]